MTGLDVALRRLGPVAIAELKGEIDMANADDLVMALEAEEVTLARGVAVDLSHVTYIDSAGVRALFKVARTLADMEVKLAVVVPEASSLRRLAKIARLDRVASICMSPAEAVDLLTAV